VLEIGFPHGQRSLVGDDQMDIERGWGPSGPSEGPGLTGRWSQCVRVCACSCARYVVMVFEKDPLGLGAAQW
jgi:hypothetical protein